MDIAIAEPVTRPRPVSGPFVWTGPEIAARKQEWIRELTPPEIAELEQAAAAFIEVLARWPR